MNLTRFAQRPRLRRWHMITGLAVLALVVAGIIGAQGDGHPRGADSRAGSAPAGPVPAIAPAGPDGLAAGGATAAPSSGRGSSSSDMAARSPGDGVAPSPLPAAPNSKVVKTGSIALEVGRGGVASAASRAGTIATGAGGFVADSHSDTTSDHPTADVTIRVPSAAFDIVLQQVRDLGKVVTTQVSGKDVTADYVDLQARLQALQSSRQQFETLLLKAQSIPDILSVQDRIDSLQVQIEQLQGQQQVLDDQSTFATLAISISDLAPAAVTHHNRKGFGAAWHDAGHDFTSAFRHVVAGSGIVAFWLLFLGVFGAVGIGVRRSVRRRQTSGGSSLTDSVKSA